MPTPANELVVRHVLDDLLHSLAAVALRVLDLLADLSERSADPCHLDRRQYPLGIARNAPWIEVARAVARHATHAGCAHAPRTALHGRLVHVHVLSLPRRIVGGMTIETTRAQ